MTANGTHGVSVKERAKNKTIDAIRKAVYSPLSETTIQGAANLMINFRGGDDLTLDEVTVGVRPCKTGYFSQRKRTVRRRFWTKK